MPLGCWLSALLLPLRAQEWGVRFVDIVCYRLGRSTGARRGHIQVPRFAIKCQLMSDGDVVMIILPIPIGLAHAGARAFVLEFGQDSTTSILSAGVIL